MTLFFRPSLHTLTLAMAACTCLQVAQTVILLVSTSAPPPQAKASTVQAASLHQTGEGTYSIKRKDLEALLANTSGMATQARIVPSFRDGKPRGFKLYALQPDSIFTRFGLLNGDILQSVNGFPLDYPEHALQAYNHLRTASRIEFDVEREGQTVHKTCTVQD